MIKNQFQAISINLEAAAVRHGQMEGRDFLVVPMVMLTEGVHAGSEGPLYYSSEELAKIPAVWNHKPVVIHHPEMNGQAVSACDPDILTNRKVGVIMNTTFEDGRLKAEAWLEAGRLKKIDERVMTALEEGKMVEVSTGLYTDNESMEGVWNGEPYTAVVRNCRPDHLAILYDKKGACSIEDGAGLLRNAAGEVELTQVETNLLSQYRAIINEKSHNDLWQDLSNLLGDKTYVVDVFDTFVIYDKGDKLFQQKYTVTDDKAKLEGLPMEVIRVTTYQTPDGKVVSNVRKDTRMDKQKFVTDLIANEASQWVAEDKEYLLGLDEDKLQKMVPVENKEPEKTPVQNAVGAGVKEIEVKPEPKPEPTDNEGEEKSLTVDQYVANAPEAVRDMLTAGLQAHQVEKAKRIAIIVANKQNMFTPEQLQAKDLSELTALAHLATPPEQPKPTFQGLAEPANVSVEAQVLPIPTLNFDKKETA